MIKKIDMNERSKYIFFLIFLFLFLNSTTLDERAGGGGAVGEDE